MDWLPDESSPGTGSPSVVARATPEDSPQPAPHGSSELRACGKRTYSSERQARIATRHAHWRVRTYWCQRCSGYHVTNGEKKERWGRTK